MENNELTQQLTDEVREEINPQNGNSLSEYAKSILEVLSESSDPVGRANVLSRGRMTTGEWSLGIKELKERNMVVQTGNRRTAKYSLA